MVRILGSVLLLALLSLACVSTVSAQPIEKAKEANATGSITDVQLGEMLTNMGYEHKKGTYAGGAFYYDVKVTSGGYDLTVRIGLSPNKRAIWLMSYLGDLPSDVPAEKLRALLQAVNTKTGKMQFRMTGNALKADQPMDNFGVTPARLKYELEDFVASLQDTASLWAPKAEKK
jgi:hypothetical protein